MNVLMIGDSIRMFYQGAVQETLGDTYKLYGPKDNCRFSAYVLNSLRFWLAELPQPDIIHFNVGLWDTAILYPEDGCFTDVDAYVSNMKKILRVLKSTGATVIFATTTPVSDGKDKLPGPVPPAHNNSDIIRYNAAVLEAFRGEDIIVNDLFSLLYADKEKYLSTDMIHPNDEGVRVLSEAVAHAIRTCPAVERQHTEQVICQEKQSEKTIQ